VEYNSLKLIFNNILKWVNIIWKTGINIKLQIYTTQWQAENILIWFKHKIPFQNKLYQVLLFL